MKVFDIPKLSKDNWDKLQLYLKDLREYKVRVEELQKEYNKSISEEMEKIGITLGLIDSVLGRTYTAEEVVNEIREKFKQLYNKGGNK